MRVSRLPDPDFDLNWPDDDDEEWPDVIWPDSNLDWDIPEYIHPPQQFRDRSNGE
jgi:hypothetical protein